VTIVLTGEADEMKCLIARKKDFYAAHVVVSETRAHICACAVKITLLN